MVATKSKPKTYEHRVLWEDRDPGTEVRQCGSCGVPTTGYGQTLRHVGEGVRPTLPLRTDVASFLDAVRLALLAQDRLIGVIDTTPEDIARVIVEELYEAGALRTGRSAWKRPERRGRAA